jgi:phage terminase large subunit-like protein
MLFYFCQIWGGYGLRRFDEKPPAAVVCHFEGMDGWGRFDEKPPAAVVSHFQGLGRFDQGDQKSWFGFRELVDVVWS